MAGYIGSKASVVSSGAERKKTFAITTSTTSLTGLSYTVDQVHVFHNGVRLVDGTDYTATNGTSITLTSAAESGDEVVVVSYATFQVADAYTQAEADAEFVQDPNGAITVSGSNVGIGTSSPLYKMHLYGADNQLATFESTDENANIGFKDSATTSVAQVGIKSNDLFFAAGGTERMRIDSSGNVGIGTSSPNHRFHLENYNASLAVISDVNGSSTIFLGDTADNNKGRIIYTQSIDTMKLLTNGSERLRIDSSGNTMIATNTAGGTGGWTFYPTGSGSSPYIVINKTNGANTTALAFQVSGVAKGSITYSSSSTSYNTSSDYRLKTDAQPMTGASARVQALNPVNFEWIADGTRVDGFLAHEAQEVVPECATGTKDAVDADGNPDYQGIDQSKLVPLLTAALQEALTKIDDMETRLAALEAV